MSEEKEGWFDAFSEIFKINPLILVTCILLMNILYYIWNSEMTLHLKAFALFTAGFFYIVALFFEFYRLEKKREAKKRVFSE